MTLNSSVEDDDGPPSTDVGLANRLEASWRQVWIWAARLFTVITVCRILFWGLATHFVRFRMAYQGWSVVLPVDTALSALGVAAATALPLFALAWTNATRGPERSTPVGQSATDRAFIILGLLRVLGGISLVVGALTIVRYNLISGWAITVFLSLTLGTIFKAAPVLFDLDEVWLARRIDRLRMAASRWDRLPTDRMLTSTSTWWLRRIARLWLVGCLPLFIVAIAIRLAHLPTVSQVAVPKEVLLTLALSGVGAFAAFFTTAATYGAVAVDSLLVSWICSTIFLVMYVWLVFNTLLLQPGPTGTVLQGLGFSVTVLIQKLLLWWQVRSTVRPNNPRLTVRTRCSDVVIEITQRRIARELQKIELGMTNKSTAHVRRRSLMGRKYLSGRSGEGQAKLDTPNFNQPLKEEQDPEPPRPDGALVDTSKAGPDRIVTRSYAIGFVIHRKIR